MSSSNTSISNSKINLDILPLSFKNDVFELNLKYFKISQPEIYNAVVNHSCKRYRLCCNPDGSPNIYDMENENALYSTFTMEDSLRVIHQNIGQMCCIATIPETLMRGGKDAWRKDNPIQRDMLDKLYNSGVFADLNLSSHNLGPLDAIRTDYFPLLRINGIGLGYHIIELLKSKSISYMTVYEPHIDLFYTSLFTISWQLIFKYFDFQGKDLNLTVATTPDQAIQLNTQFIQQRLLPLTSYYFRYNHLQTNQIKEINVKEPNADAITRSEADGGWFEDQRTGFYLGLRNIKRNNKFFSGKKIKRYFRAFIVGSGPSLNDSIKYIKLHKNSALIISCGSAITPLLKAGIIPDYEVVQERLWHIAKLEEKYDPKLIKEISLLKLNVVSPKIDKYYKETLVFQKFRDPGSSFLNENYKVTTAVNPTVTNAGIAMCAELGVDEAYLFGVDYGAPQDSGTMHAKNTIYEELSVDDSVESKTTFDLPGNLGTVIRTDTILSWSLRTTEQKIAEHPHVKWFNVGEGALISGATPVKPESFPSRFKKKIQKKLLRSEISQCFDNNYSPTDIFERLKTTQMSQVEEYFKALLGFNNSHPKTREEIINVLSLLYKAVNVGQFQSHFLPSSLLSYGFKQFVNDVYIQSSLEKSDEDASQFFHTSKEILTEYIAAIENDLVRILNLIELDTETELITHGSGELHFSSN